jgi:phosphohistidine phosphatase
MKLYLLRHATAEEGHPGQPDRARRLTGDGVAESRTVGAALKRLGVKLDLIVTSPAVRAAETARIVSQALDIEMVDDDGLSPGCRLRDLEAVVARFPHAEQLIVVGHEPDFSEIIAVLTGGRVVMKKGGLARLNVHGIEPHSAHLEWLATPKVMGPVGE